MFISWSGHLVAATLGAFLYAPSALSQTAATGPFAKVPAFPTACYTENETFAAKLEGAQAAVRAEAARQREVNSKIEQDFQNIDPMEMASRMQAWMMSNPQEAMKYAQAAQSVGQDLNTIGPELNAAAAGFDAENKELVAKYKAALKTAYAPADARMAAVNKKLADANECGFGDTECRVPDWAWVEYDAIQKQRDAAYQANCAQWWTAAGPVHGYLKRYRDWLVQKWIPSWTKSDDARLTQYAIMNTPAASWKSVLPHENADKYMGVAWTLFALRDEKPICIAKGCR